MIRLLHQAAFAAGVLAVAWVGSGYLTSNPSALALVLLIGAFFGAGALELHRFRRATAALVRVLASTPAAPADFETWLADVPPSLRTAVRLRVEGERVALPGPALTPYLAGLLVLLGMLGTFVGMVVTLKGTGLALENATSLEAIRASLAAPVKGLGQAFGTSVAGVAASAMLGLMSALARRERQAAARQLDAQIAAPLRRFTRAHQREESQRLLRAQAEAMPALVTQLQTLAAQIERQGEVMHERLLARQAEFQHEAQRAHAALADSVGRSLQTSLAESARLAGAAIEPAVQSTLAGLARETATLRDTLAAAVQQQLDGTNARVEAHAASFLRRVADDHAAWNAEVAARERELRAALGDSLARDNAMLDERRHLLATLSGLLDSIRHAGTEQRAAIDALVQATADVLGRAGARFVETVDAESRALQAVTAQVSGGAAEVASLGEGFGLAVQLFSRASEQMTAQLQRIEAALGQSMTRSDEQLAYYVAQAREIVELTLGSQKQIVDDLRQFARAPAEAPA
jgi:hypothetical protein